MLHFDNFACNQDKKKQFSGIRRQTRRV